MFEKFYHINEKHRSFLTLVVKILRALIFIIGFDFEQCKAFFRTNNYHENYGSFNHENAINLFPVFST